MKTLFTLLIALLLTAAAAAQGIHSAESKRKEMSKFPNLAGVWKGSGWTQEGGTKKTFTGTETINAKLDGLAYLVEGKFANPEGKIVHETLAVINYDPITGYRFRSYLANGISGEYGILIMPAGFRWGYEFPAGKVRFTITVDGNTWFEEGEIMTDGKAWTKIFEMKLERVRQ